MMSSLNMENDFSMAGVTLRSLLENRDLLSIPPRAKYTSKEDKEGCEAYCDATAAFLGPNLWDKTLPDFKLEYIDLDDLLGNNNNNNGANEVQQKMMDSEPSNKQENAPRLLQLASPQEPISTHLQGGSMPPCIQQPPSVPQQHQPQHHSQSNPTPPPSPSISCSSPLSSPEDMQGINSNMDCKFSPTDLALATPPGHDHFDPTSTALQEDDLKPQPMIKKSRKHFVPEDLKDDKYWARRRKNNIAAKRSREARRVKENQIVLRASYLEKENNTLKDDVQRLKTENDMLKNQLKKYTH